jgi:flagellar basal-body rod protein FlgB
MSERAAGKIELFDETFNGLQRAVDIATQKQAIIAHNIANAKTPGFEPLEFDSVLNKAVKRANKNVVLEDEMDALSRNANDHSSYVKLLATKIGILRTVVTQGRK